MWEGSRGEGIQQRLEEREWQKQKAATSITGWATFLQAGGKARVKDNNKSVGEGRRCLGEREKKINSSQTETKWVAGDGVRLSGLGLFRSTDIYRVADRSSPSSPWKVQMLTDPQRKCYAVWINALSHLSTGLLLLFLHLCALQLSFCRCVRQSVFRPWSYLSIRFYQQRIDSQSDC